MDAVVRIWDFLSRHVKHTIDLKVGRTHPPTCRPEFSPDGTYLLFSTSNGFICFNSLTGAEVSQVVVSPKQRLTGHVWTQTGGVVSGHSDGSLIYWGGNDK
eukprot:GHVR01163810.1.p1 GENE.GHVR01163810.1~~GHVR01163810.1.p1  ORF type:complete len:101 (+),score=13.35 GHVR01163810.1:159-461(+)